MFGLLLSLLAIKVSGQHIGTYQHEIHPSLPVKSCSGAGSCANLSTSITMDENWRWLHGKNNYQNCFVDNVWDTTICSDNKKCADNCALDGADYKSVYSVTTTPAGALNMKLVTHFDYAKNIGSRVYLMASETKYQMFKLLNKEFSFEVDASKLPCGVNAALYFVEMDEDGGMKKHPGNKAGAQYGTGYCSAKCPRNLRFVDGEVSIRLVPEHVSSTENCVLTSTKANVEGWIPSEVDRTAGTGKYGSCCAEVDIWEANSNSNALTAHPCSIFGHARCEGPDCGNSFYSMCDNDGCDFNSYRMGDASFYGPGKTVDTTKNFTVVTQFITDDGTDTGRLTEIRRKYIQNGVVINNSATKVPAVTSTNSITDKFCYQQKKAFNDTNHFEQHGGMRAVGEALSRGMVLAISILDDYDNHMLWLDGPFPKNKDSSAPGVVRGSCSSDSGEPLEVEGGRPQVTYRNIQFGDIGSTFDGAY
jgi:cellulose 1,4-beta-cellobiosidase